MLFEMGIADAYSIPWEFVPADRKDKVGSVDFQSFRQNPMYPTIKPGRYTDDTQRGVANSKVILSGNPFDPKAYVSSYIETFRCDRRDAYSRRFQKLIEAAADIQPELSDDYFNTTIIRQASSNGSIMGVVPLGYLNDPADVALAAACQALSTHAADTIPYAQAIALKAHSFLHPESGKGTFDSLCSQYISAIDLPAWGIRNPGPATMSAKDTYKVVMRLLHYAPKSYCGIIKKAIEVGGDTDSVAAIAVAIASCSQDYVNDIPAGLIEQFEDVKSRAELIYYDKQLKEKFIC